jgi:hypothetical protein
MKMKLFENLKSALGEEAVEELQQKFHEAVEDGVKIKLGERVKQLEEKSEEFIEKKVASLVESKEKALLKEYEEKLKAYGEEVVANLDTFLESSIVETVSESVIEDVAKLQMYAPIVSDMIESFKTHFTPLAPKDSDTALADALKESSELKKMLDKTMSENRKLVSMTERAAIRVLFVEKTQGLTKSAKTKIWEMIQDMDFDTAERKIGGLVSMVEEFSMGDEDNSIGGVTGTEDSTEGEFGADGSEDEPKTTLEISKESWDAMNAVQVEDEENPPKSKLFVDLVTPYIVTEEGEESDEGAGEYGENEEFGDEGTEDGVGGEEGEEPVMVTFELPESVVEELKSMFAEDDFGDVPEDVQDSIRGVITDESEEGSEGGEVTGEEGIEGADYSESRTAPKGDSLTEWHKKWAKV